MKYITFNPSVINNSKAYKYLTTIKTKYKNNYVYVITNRYKEMYIGSRSSNKDPLQDIGITYFTSSKYVDFNSQNSKEWDIKIVGVFDNRADAICLESALQIQNDVVNNKLFLNRSIQTITGFDTSNNNNLYRKVSKWRGENIIFNCDISDNLPQSTQFKWITNNRFVSDREKYLRKFRVSGSKNPMHGKHISDKHKQSISDKLTGREKSETEKSNISKSLMGHIVTDKTKNKISETRKKLKLKQIWCTDKETETLIHSKDIELFLIKNKNFKIGRLLVSCPYCDKVGISGNMKRWHFNNCKFFKPPIIS